MTVKNPIEMYVRVLLRVSYDRFALISFIVKEITGVGKTKNPLKFKFIDRL